MRYIKFKQKGTSNIMVIKNYILPGVNCLKNIFFGTRFKTLILALVFTFVASCAFAPPESTYFHPSMDFGAIKTVAVMPFKNLSNNKSAAGRVRDVFITMLLSTGEMYVLPPGEVARASVRAGITTPTSPATEEIIKLAAITKVNAVITGVIREYGEVRSGSTSANIISFSLQMIETQSGQVVWNASSTKGGITMKDRLLGGGGKPMNEITEIAVNDIINKLF